MQNKKILVTGCAGFIPSFVVERLLVKGAFVYGIDNLSNGSMKNMENFIKNKNFIYTRDDICNTKLLESLVKKSDYVYHAAVRGLGISTKDPLLELQVNIQATLSLLEIIRKHPIQRMLYTSSASVYGNSFSLPEKENDFTSPLSPYGVSKLAAERYCIAYNNLFKIPVVCLRYFNTYGPRQKKDSAYGGVVSIFIDNALNNRPLPVYGTGKQTRDFTFVNDTVNATINAFTANEVMGKVINISAEKECSVQHLAKLVKKISGKKNLEIKYIEKRLIDNIDRRWGDISLAKKFLNYHPSTSLEEGLKITYEWNKNSG